MRAYMLMAGVMTITVSAHAEPRVFYTAHFPDQTSIQMSVIQDRAARDGEYDFDVAIALTQLDPAGAVKFLDASRHHARIRCAAPAYVGFGDHRFPVHMRTAPSDWKEDLWKAYCELPSS